MADTSYDNSQMKCPNCGYAADSAKFAVSGGSSGTSDPSAPGTLRTPDGAMASGTGMNAGQIGVSGGKPAGALSNSGQRAIALAQRTPVSQAWDVMISRGPDGTAIVRHRRGGAEIGRIGRTEDGRYTGISGGQPGQPHTHQRAALAELIGGWNRGTVNLMRAPSDVPAAQPPVQTALMQQLGVPAVKLATPATGAGSGPRVTLAAGSDDDSSDSGNSSGPGGLTPRGVAIYKKLLAKGFPAARALAFARNSQNGPPGNKSS
jgi:hypothetical protein